MNEILTGLGIEERNPGGFCGERMGSGPELEVTTPIDGSQLAAVQQVTEGEYDTIVSRAQDAFLPNSIQCSLCRRVAARWEV